MADVEPGAAHRGDAVGAGGESSAPVAEGQADDLEQAIQAFLAEAGTGVISVSRVVNPLLHVWSIARDVDAAAPVESLLTVLVGRSLTTSDELEGTMREVRAALASSRPLVQV